MSDADKWPPRQTMHGMPDSFADELHELIGEYLDKRMTFDEIADDLDYMLSQISLYSSAKAS